MNATTQQPTTVQPTLSTGGMLTQVSSVLAAIVLLILGCAWLAKRFGIAGRRGGSQTLNISASCQLGQRERVVVVDVEDARLVLGVTAHQISLLHTLPAKAAEETVPPVATDFRQVLATLMKGSGKQK